MADSALSAFKPVPTSTVNLSVTTTSASVALPANVVSAANGNSNACQAMQLYNSGTAIVYVKDGPVGTTAVAPNGATPGDFPVYPAAPPVVIQFSNSAPAVVAAVTSTGTGTLTITPGNGI